MNLSNGLMNVVQIVDDQGVPIPQQSTEKTYLLLMYADKTDEDSYETQHFEVTTGRFITAETILRWMETYEYGRVDIFRSVVVSEKSDNFTVKNISFYTFLRHCIEHGVPIGIREPGGSPLTVDDINQFVINEYDDLCQDMKIDGEEDLDRFYEADGNYRQYIPNH